MTMPESAGSVRRTWAAGRHLLRHVSIQSKLILMLVLCTILAAAVVGAIAFDERRARVLNVLAEQEVGQTAAG